jgi:hypothetical protein
MPIPNQRATSLPASREKAATRLRAPSASTIKPHVLRSLNTNVASATKTFDDEIARMPSMIAHTPANASMIVAKPTQGFDPARSFNVDPTRTDRRPRPARGVALNSAMRRGCHDRPPPSLTTIGGSFNATSRATRRIGVSPLVQAPEDVHRACLVLRADVVDDVLVCVEVER